MAEAGLQPKIENENFIEELKDLLSLDYAAVAAYEVAIERMTNEDYKNKLHEFKGDHLAHIKNLTEFLKEGGYGFPTGAGMKSILTQGKVYLANLIGDDIILKAMESNEKQTSQSYADINRYEEIPKNIKKILLRGYEDEKKHLSWIDSELKIKNANKKSNS